MKAEKSQPRTSETERSEVRVALSHPDRVLFPEQGITKVELALYYAQVAEPMLVHVADRPLMLVRCPEGAAGACFHQKHPTRGMQRAVARVPIAERTGQVRSHMSVRDVEGLISLVQIGALEIHTWGSRIQRLEQPDQLTFDLDPDEGLAWSRVIEAAHRVRAELHALDLESYLKTTGGKGLHVVVPIRPLATWDEAKPFCKALCDRIVRAEPDAYVTNIAKAKRKGKVLLDYLRNGRGATAVCAYSTRARSGAPVATPVDWSELSDSLRPDTFDIHAVVDRIARRSCDPWQGFGKRRQGLTASRLRALRAA